MNDRSEMTIDYTPSGRNGIVTLTVRLGDDILAVEKIDLSKEKSRAAFAKSLANGRPGIDAAAVEGELLRSAAELAKSQGSQTPTIDAMPREIDGSRIVRPERFITTEVSGLGVSMMTERDGHVAGCNMLYLSRSDGRREVMPMPLTIEVADGQSYCVHPQPSSPTTTGEAGWSSTAREAWLAGAESPHPAEVFRRICEQLAMFVDFPPELAAGTVATLALWVLLTYVYPAWSAIPYLFIGGAMASGKTRVFEVLSRLVFRPLASSNISAPALFRTLHDRGGTLLLDEAERLKQSNDPAAGELCLMLLAGYKRGGKATRLEPIGDNYRMVSFDVFGPKALACIVGLPPALASRCIAIMMLRAAPRSAKPRQRIDADPAGWQSLRDDLHALALDYGATWLELAQRTDVCPAMSGRDFELWQPLLALASWIELHGARGLLQLVTSHALATIDAAQDDRMPDTDESLLRALADALRTGMTPTPNDVLAAANDADPASFKAWTARGVAAVLKRYGLTTRKTQGRKVYPRETIPRLRQVQSDYHVDLGFGETAESTTPSSTTYPDMPQCPLSRA